MYPGRRSRSRNSTPMNYINLKTVEVGRGRSGYGFTMNGQYPCTLGTIMPGSPGEAAGLTPDVCVMAVNGENVTRMSHEQIIKLIGSTSGVLRLTVADAVPMSDSSDDDYVQQRKYRTRHQQYRSKSATPSAQSRAEMVVAEIQRGALMRPYGNQMYPTMPQHATAALDNSKFAPGHLSPYNQMSQADRMYQQSPQMYAEEALQYANLPKMQKPRKNRYPGDGRSHSALPHNSFYERYDPMDDVDEDRALSPIELSNIMYPSMQPRAPRARSPQRQMQHVPMTQQGHMPLNQPAMMRCVVGYLGSIDIPASANLPTASLQAIRGCVRRLRMEQRVHSLMLMEITSIGVTLINSNRKVTVLYPADRVAFSGVCPDDKRVFGIVTAQNPEDMIDSIDSDDEPIGSSCHVFFVDPELSHHSIHAQCAMQFGVQCATDPDTGLCEEFPPSSRPILHNVAQLYRDRQSHMMHYADMYGQSPFNAGLGLPTNRSNSNSSNSDSGFGNGNHDSNGNSGGPDHVILNVAAHIRSQRARGNIPGATTPTNARFTNHFSMSQSSDPYSLSSNATSPSSAEKSPQSGISPSGEHSGRLTPRARPDPIGFQSPNAKQSNSSRPRPQSVNTIQHQPKATPANNRHIATLDRYPHRRPDNMMFNTAYGGPVIQPKIKTKPHVPPRMDTGITGLPPSGRHSMYMGSSDLLHESNRRDEDDGAHVRFMRQVRLVQTQTHLFISHNLNVFICSPSHGR